MTFSNIEDRKAYAKAHYAANKAGYNPARQKRRIDAAEQKAKDRAKEKALEERKKSAAIAKEKAAAVKPLNAIPKTLVGQLAWILREHYALELPENRKRHRRNGEGAPLSAWMRGVRKNTPSKIMELANGRPYYPYSTWNASSAVLADRIAKRYEISSVQAALLYEYVLSRYRGAETGPRYAMEVGVPSTGKYVLDETLRCWFAAKSAIESACEKYKLNLHRLPLRALLDDRVTLIILQIQFNQLLKTLPTLKGTSHAN